MLKKPEVVETVLYLMIVNFVIKFDVHCNDPVDLVGRKVVSWSAPNHKYYRNSVLLKQEKSFFCFYSPTVNADLVVVIRNKEINIEKRVEKFYFPFNLQYLGEPLNLYNSFLKNFQ